MSGCSSPLTDTTGRHYRHPLSAHQAADAFERQRDLSLRSQSERGPALPRQRGRIGADVHTPLRGEPGTKMRRSHQLDLRDVAVFAVRRGSRQPAAPRLAPHLESVANEQAERTAKDDPGRGLREAGVPDPVLDAPDLCAALQ